MQSLCLGPYQISSPDFPGVTGKVFTDLSKPRRVVVITPKESISAPPSLGAVLLHSASNSTCDIRWYECPDQLGRTYTVVPGMCGVTITSFENGLLQEQDCIASVYGSEFFCYGTITTADGSNQGPDCKVVAEFDGHLFIVTGHSGYSNGLDDCHCNDIVSLFAGEGGGDTSPDGPGEQDIPDAPPAPDFTNGESEDRSSVSEEDRTIWETGVPTESVGLNTVCFPEVTAISDNKSACESHENPSVAVLPSGQTIIAYENRAEDGSTKISLALLNSSVPVSIFYFRSLSYGRLINDESFIYGSGTFEIFDDVLFSVNGVVPSLQIGFLSGPLRGGTPMDIVSIERVLQDNGLPKHVVTFDSRDRQADFKDSNDAFNVSFFIARKENNNPGGIDLLDLPDHLDENGNKSIVAHPSVDIARNNYMIDSAQHIFLSYQAFENNQWNIYLRQIILSDRNSEPPQYLPPYLFESPSSSVLNISFYPETKVVYRLTQISVVSNLFCALFEVFLQDGRQVLNCNTSATGETTTSCGLMAENQIATVEVVYSLTDCDPSDITQTPDWTVGDEILDIYPPTPAAIINGRGNPDCISQIITRPDTSQWCFKESVCNQYFVFDDPYCPSPYIDNIEFTYYPADLWQIKTNDGIISRVLYHMSAAVTQERRKDTMSEEIDFMFVVDHSDSMWDEISKIRQAVPRLAQELRDAGFDVRFGLTVYARRLGISPSPSDVGPICNDVTTTCGPSVFFDGLQGSVDCNIEPSEEKGFTRDLSLLQDSLNCWWTQACAWAQHWAAIQFAVEDERFSWRPNANKFMFLVTDTSEEEVPDDHTCVETLTGSTYFDQAHLAQNSLIQRNVQLIVAHDPIKPGVFSAISSASGWSGSTYNVYSEDYGVVFGDVIKNILRSLSGLKVLERDDPGYGATFLRNAETLITYNADLLDIWTNEKNRLRFTDQPPVGPGPLKGLSNFPFDILNTKVYGVDPVYISGQPSNWIYYLSPGNLVFDYPHVGAVGPNRYDPVLIANNATRSCVSVSNRNHVIVAYESYEGNLPHIHIKGTGDFNCNSIVGPAGHRLTRAVNSNDFDFFHEVTSFGERVNQLCDVVIDKNDVTHITWQSNRDGVWEIYYANSVDLFSPVRVTEANSRSSMPRIDVDDSGVVYIVYHDNRFGPYEIMLSFKSERRVLPLLQQDAYLASLRSNYQHFTNTLPIIISNPGTPVPAAGLLWAVKTASASGNGNENIIFAIEDTNSSAKTLGGTLTKEVVAIAGSRTGSFYGLTSNFELLLMVDENDPYRESILEIDTLSVQTIGTVELLSELHISSKIVDVTVDNAHRLWVLAADEIQSGKKQLRLVQINIDTAAIVRESILFTDIDQLQGAVTSLNNGDFYIVAYRDGGAQLYHSHYPTITTDDATLALSFVANLSSDITTIASDFEDTIFGVADGVLYSIEKNGELTLLADLKIDNGDEADPLAVVSGIGYQFSGAFKLSGTSGFFNIILEFYDNIGLLGSPVLTIDSRENLEAFVNIATQSTLDDPYFEDAYFANAKGVFLKVGESAIIHFDASHFNPTQSRLAYPFAFDTNQTYFPRVLIIRPDGTTSLINEVQESSFSCNRCSSLGTNLFNVEGCSYSWTVSGSGRYNFFVDFYADAEYQHLVARFNGLPHDDDLAYFEVNNESATQHWGEGGLEVNHDQELFIQVYPTLDPDSGLLCNVTYYVRVVQCNDSTCESSQVINTGTFRCVCSSAVLGDESTVALSQLSRWYSSAGGYSDTRVTDSPSNSLRPVIKTRSSGAAIIVFEDYSSILAKLKAATFRQADVNEIFSSGSKSWFDYDFDITGQNADISLDILDRTTMAYEKPISVNGRGISDEELPNKSLGYRVCDFVESGEEVDNTCDISQLTGNVITSDPFIVSSVTKKVLIKSDFVQYYTYNSDGNTVPVVNECDIVLQIWGTPEVVAYRVRNESDVDFSNWCPYSPEISNNYVEIVHRLSPGSGAKEVCIQAMTYSGITTEFCMPVIADYHQITFETRLYADDNYTQLLPRHEGFFVASTNVYDQTSQQFDTKKTIYVELIPDRVIAANVINFDVLQQGESDQFFLSAVKSINASGQEVFRGSFRINVEDSVLNKDGLARIRPSFPGSCIDTHGFISAESQFNPDRFNTMTSEIPDSVDALSVYRQEISGRLGVGVTIRPEDPYLIFGDPSFFINRKTPIQKGVPHKAGQNDGDSSDEDSSGDPGSSG